MKQRHLQEYFINRYQLRIAEDCQDELIEGTMASTDGSPSVPVIKGIPRWVYGVNYTDSFGFQWNKFRSLQLDSQSGLKLSAERLWKFTEWNPADLKGKLVLEVGSGAGRFTEILLQTGAKVISFDCSDAVEVNYRNNKDKGNLFLFQGDLFQIPFPDEYFDYIFCFGVLQHIPDPDKGYRDIFKKLKPGGKIAIDYYEKTIFPFVNNTPKYFWRPITTRMPKILLLKIIELYIPIWLPIDTIIRSIPKLGLRLLGFIPIPCWNYLGVGLSYKQRIQWAILDTFDALSSRYDIPKNKREILAMVASPQNESEHIFFGSNGIVANITKKNTNRTP